VRTGDVSSDPRSFLEFLDRVKVRHAERFPTLKVPHVLSFMGTTSAAGTFASCSVHPLRKIERGSAARELRILLGGALPRPPGPGECLSVHMTRVERFQGFQVKTRALVPGAGEKDLLEATPGGLLVKGAHIYTVHHSPYTLQFFESVPYEEVAETLAGLGHAIVAIGETANLSPRFIWHHEVKDGKVVLFHGDGLALKTYMNIRQNRSEVRVIVDLDTFTGVQLFGTVEEFAPHQHPEAFEKICQGFQVGGWGKPSRVFKFTPTRFEPIAPQA
jgi:hypothetical protein